MNLFLKMIVTFLILGKLPRKPALLLLSQWIGSMTHPA